MEIIIPQIDLKSIAPLLILTVTALVVLILGLFSSKESKVGYYFFSLLGIGLALMFTVKQFGTTSFSFNGAYVVDNFSIFFNVVILLSTALILMMSGSYLRREDINYGEYYCLLLFATVGMIIMTSGSSLLMIFLGLEVLSISLYILAGFKRDNVRSTEAALKYFLLGAFTTGFLLFGIAFIYGATGSVDLRVIADFLKNDGSKVTSDPMMILGLILLIFGFGFKVAAVPFHNWVPDVYEGAPTPVTAFFASGPKAAGFAVFFRVFLMSFSELDVHWTKILWILAVLTMTVGNLVALKQTSIKRMLAYSSIAHAGYIMVALVSASSLGMASVLFYMVAYALMNIGAFAIVIIMGRKGEDNTQLSDYSGFGYKHPVLAIAMTIFMLSMAGMPPLAGFVGKFYVFSAAIESGFITLAVIGVINSVISVYYYLRVTVFMYMKPPMREFSPLSTSPFIILVLIITLWGTIQFGIFPSCIINLAQKSILILQ
ncbi:MAG: NADH-quinone oxidoreductase subunit N [Candidatus Anammoxibacter sp.]